MLLDDIKKFFEESNFRPLGINAEGIFLYVRNREEGLYAVLLLHCQNGTEFTSQQYQNIKRQVTENLLKNTSNKVFIQTLLVTGNVSLADRINTREAEAWIVDTQNLRLIIYDNQRNDFAGIKKPLESFLSVKFNQQYISEGIGYEDTRSANDYRERGTLAKYLSPCNTVIVILNVLVFLVVNNLLPDSKENFLVGAGALNWRDVLEKGEFYRLFTYMFLHGGFSHLLNNMIVLLFIGDNLERATGKWRYLVIYLSSGIIAGVSSILYNMVKMDEVISIGASGAIFGVVGAMAFVVLVNRGRLENISTRQIVFFVILSLYGGLTSQGIDNAAHIGGLIGGILLGIILYRKQKKRDGGRENEY